MIDLICKEYGIKNYIICSDGSIDVNGNVDLSMKKLTKLPLKFNKVSGSFYCNNNQLITLEGSPREIGVHFHCSHNKLTSLEGGPKEVGRYFCCQYNQLTSLEGGPKKVCGNFYCDRYISDIEPYIIEFLNDIIIKVDYTRYKKVNDRDKIINNILT